MVPISNNFCKILIQYKRFFQFCQFWVACSMEHSVYNIYDDVSNLESSCCSRRAFYGEKNMQTMPHTAYSSDKAPYNFFAFSKLKLALKGQHLGDLDGIKMKTSQYLQHLNLIPESAFRKCFKDRVLSEQDEA